VRKLLRSAVEWLNKPVSEAPGDELVAVAEVLSSFEGQHYVNELMIHDIKAVLFTSDANGVQPLWSVFIGHRVMVLARDAERAAQIINAAEPRITQG